MPPDGTLLLSAAQIASLIASCVLGDTLDALLFK